MKQKGFSVIYIVLFVLLIIGVVSIVLKNPGSTSQKVIDLAKELYQEKKAQGLNFNNGPCLSNNMLPDWVVDIAHDPRQPIDDVPENQCAAFKEGKAHHFVELDTKGNLIRIF